ncbi:hypothetical protein B0O80DRAFT_485085 [Mortierella sp. GBAus27b]|nr:hypothetical protein B0O80DRAFT_485085 [Mortierella sp. GBAus27b]
MYSHIISSPRGHLTLHQSLQLANFFLEHAAKTQDSDIALVLCHETEVSLSQTKKAARHTDDTTAQHGIGTAYIGLGKILEGRGLQKEAKAIYKKAEKLGVKLEDKGQLVQPTQHSQQPSESSSMQSSPLQPSPSQPSQPLQPTVPEGSESSTKGKSKTTESDPKKGKPKQSKRIATIPPNIFDQNVPPQSIVTKLPDTDERLTSTPQLACCLGLLKNSHTLDNILEENARNWLQVVENDEDEQERLKVLATDVVRTFKKEEIKDSRAVAEVVCLAPILDKEAFRDLLKQFYDGINHSELLDFHQLEGLAQMIQGVDADYVQADDLVKILELLSRRLQDTNQRSPQYIYQLTLTVSFVLDAMADTKVEGLDRETLHEPLLKFLGSFKVTSDPFLMYQVAYAYQALLCVPDNETLWQATLRRSNKVIKGISGLVSAVKGFDLNGFIDGLSNIQQGFAGASEVIKVVVSTFDDVKSLADGGKGFLKGLKEGLSFQRKCAWYPALRGADALIQDGEFVAFRRLVCEAPCRMDPAFQWGVCLRLAEIAVSYTWDARTRRSATSFLGEIYRNEDDWGDQASIKEWILSILMRLASSTGNTSQCK